MCVECVCVECVCVCVDVVGACVQYVWCVGLCVLIFCEYLYMFVCGHVCVCVCVCGHIYICVCVCI